MSSANGRIFAIGDIHGCAQKLDQLLSRLPFTSKDLLIFLGDYINRGPDSKGVLERLIRLERSGQQTVFLLGNHENLLLEYYRSPDENLIRYLRQNGIEQTLESYGARDLSHLYDMGFMPEEHRRFLERLELYHETDDYIFVHAGIVPGRALTEQGAQELCEIRDIFIEDGSDYGKRVIFGHTPFELPLVARNKIGIDTGAAYGNLLTAVQLPDEIFYHA